MAVGSRLQKKEKKKDTAMLIKRKKAKGVNFLRL